MIYGIGNDIVEMARITASMQNKRFMVFCFSERERTEYDGNVQKLSGCFAAKEAIAKALGTGVRGFSMDEITVMRDELGKPYFMFEGKIEQIMVSKSLTAHLAITNTNEYALANVVLEANI
jgi:holo-[acyl-carrier-protein] synthase